MLTHETRLTMHIVSSCLSSRVFKQIQLILKSHEKSLNFPFTRRTQLFPGFHESVIAEMHLAALNDLINDPRSLHNVVLA